MTEIKINISDLKSEGGDLIEELADYIRGKTQADVQTATNDITIKGEEENVSRGYLRVLLRKFLHKEELKDDFRIIGGKENALIVKEIKIREEE